MDTPGERAERQEENGKPVERRGPPPGRGRSEPGVSGGGNRPPPEQQRRKRNNEQRYAGFGDGVERAVCIRAEQVLPEAFPVESHAGAATIPPMVVARRPDELLLCTYSHFGPHVWPDGEVVTEPRDEPR